MRKARFDERLNVVIAEALKRLANRMRLAYFRGDLTGYLTRIGLSDALPNMPDETAEFSAAVKKVQGILARRIKRARQKGYLKDYLRQINMMDLLLFKKRIRTVRLWAIEGGDNNGRNDRADGNGKPKLRVVK